MSFPDYVSSSDLKFFFNLCYVLSQYGFVFLFDRFLSLVHKFRERSIVLVLV